MAIFAKHKDTSFGVADKIKVTQRIKEGEKERIQIFEGIVIGIKGRGVSKVFRVRKIGAQQIGIEKTFPLESPTVEKVEVVRSGVRGVRRSKLNYLKDKSKREIENIYQRASKRQKSKIK
ncbi:MAG: 50S ribosomal protein L19 [Candidatus Woesebacteria bacterium GW2011_GWB1_38_5b]|uniref:50S ribosomal protein L19 n=2 Tax=Candidatus Woeseibacteriota TaxID=1752722 RepID=A0A0G0K882_9BACT|nr:MAG: 50S ribosomal protein L19 [Candidatus Woesebacteria bacterium GW2011_GWB1_38_5b]OGM19810.1 MAG: 50S ribosomal protein L19 [Candidatus Woesebacteria bacterium RIFCSPHIGHO2_01_FULL_38_10]OGM59460.1 MAG: 50S ribosomal protein L19 [Candidatus Woesebacteria bacterium RIFCSPLOWO2_01_FULL_39_10b]